MLNNEEKKVLEAMIEESRCSMFPVGREYIEFEDIKEKEFYEDYKKDERLIEIQEQILNKIKGVC